MKKYWKAILGLILLIISVFALIVGLVEDDRTEIVSSFIAILFTAVFVVIERREDKVKNQLSGIALILVSILFMIGYGNLDFYIFRLRWSALFAVAGIIGLAMTFLPDKKDK